MALSKIGSAGLASGAVEAVDLANPNVFMGRNRIINGNMAIDQRSAGSSVASPSNQYTLDRWYSRQAGGGVASIQQSTTAPTGFTNSLLVTVTTADTIDAASDRYWLEQKIEGYNTSDFGFGSASAKTVTLSFWVRSSVTGTFAGSLQNGDVTRSYIFTYSISSANTWEQKSITIAGDTSGTWYTNTSAGVAVKFNIGSGSDYQGTAGSWGTTNYFNTSTATNLISTLNATWYITGVQLEVGSTATEFEQRQYGQELALCQRYYWNSQPYSNVDSLGWAIGTSSSTYGRLQVPLPTTMRAKPTISYDANVYIYSPSGPNDAITSITANYSSTTMLSVDGGTSASLTTGAFYLVYAHNSTGRVIASAEL